MKKLIAIFTLILLFLSIILIFVVITFNVPIEEVGSELAKTLLQAIVIIFAGQILSFVVERFNRDREEAVALNDYRKSFLDSITAAYIQSQKSRSQLRLEGLVTRHNSSDKCRHVKVQPYAKQMEVVNEIEFQLRSLKHEISTFSYAFSESERLVNNIEVMREVLRRLLKECQDNLPKHYDESTSLSLSNLPSLSDLLGPYDESSLTKEYGQRFHSILSSVKKDILEARRR